MARTLCCMDWRMVHQHLYSEIAQSITIRFLSFGGSTNTERPQQLGSIVDTAASHCMCALHVCSSGRFEALGDCHDTNLLHT